MAEDIIFTEEEYILMEKKSKELLGWELKSKTGMSIKEMIENPERGKEALMKAKKNAGFIDKVKLGKVLEYLEDPNWKKLLKEKLGKGE